MLQTARLRLRRWRHADREAFAEMNAHPEVMRDLGGPISRAQSDAKLARYAAAFERNGFSRWAIENQEGEFLGYAGVMCAAPDHPLGDHAEIGWRLVRHAWGAGYAAEAAQAALDDVFTRTELTEVLAYTADDNLKSRSVMTRLKLRRDPSRDFTARYETVGVWRGRVWVAAPVRRAT